jgi:hypothetical protein
VTGRRGEAALTWPQALAWRLRRHLLDPVGSESVAGVVRRLGATVAYPDEVAALAVRTRRQKSRGGEVAKALAEGRILKVFAFRGATHLVTPKEGADYLALRAASRMWELPSWQSHYGLAPGDWPAFRDVVREALADGPMTLDELGASVTAHQAFGHLGFAFDGPGNLLKPLSWQGVLAFGPPRDGRATFVGLDGNPHWAGVPELDEAGPRAVEAYFATYGPAVPDRVFYWLGDGLGAGRKRIKGWLADLGERLVPVDVGGETCYARRSDVDELVGAQPSSAVRLLPAYDQWLLGPGTADPHVTPSARRQLVTGGANVVVAGGVVSGTWTHSGDAIAVDWFPEAGPRPTALLDAEVERLSVILDPT